jgi:hypothetical protein
VKGGATYLSFSFKLVGPGFLLSGFLGSDIAEIDGKGEVYGDSDDR